MDEPPIKAPGELSNAVWGTPMATGADHRRGRRRAYLRAMTIGASLFLIALGAILTFAVTASVAGIDINTVGLILMIVGALGLILGLLFAGRRRYPGEPIDPTL